MMTCPRTIHDDAGLSNPNLLFRGRAFNADLNFKVLIGRPFDFSDLELWRPFASQTHVGGN